MSVRERVLEFLAEYGERGYMVLKAAVEAALAQQGRSARLGDFSYRELVSRLRAHGFEYNPSMLLRILERDYGVIETSYKSTTQHWWRFVSIDDVIDALEEYEQGVNVIENDREDVLDPELELLRVQIAALEPHKLIETLERLAAKPKLSPQDKLMYARLAFNELEKVVEVLRKAEAYQDELAEEIEMLKRILKLASRVAKRLLIRPAVTTKQLQHLTTITP